jgi:hypothetical protein
MSRFGGSLVAFALGFALLAASDAGATIPSCVKIKGTLLVAGEDNGDDPNAVVFKQKLLRVRFSEQDMLTEFGAPKGSCIRVTPNDPPLPDVVELVGPDGNVIMNLRQFVSVDLGTEEDVFSGSFNNDTGAESSLIIFPIEIHLGLDSLSVDVDGVAFEKFKSGAMDDDGLQKVKATIKAKLSGFAGLNAQGGEPAFFEGTITLSGKGDFNFQ